MLMIPFTSCLIILIRSLLFPTVRPLVSAENLSQEPLAPIIPEPVLAFGPSVSHILPKEGTKE